MNLNHLLPTRASRSDVAGQLRDQAAACPDDPKHPDRNTLREDQDTVEGCRARASAALLQAGSMSTANGKLALQRSAANWTIRAALLSDAAPKIDWPPPELTLLEQAEDAEYLALQLPSLESRARAS
jgi:hypothetical protein